MSEVHEMEKLPTGWMCPECSHFENLSREVLDEGDTAVTHIIREGDFIEYQLGELDKDES